MLETSKIKLQTPDGVIFTVGARMAYNIPVVRSLWENLTMREKKQGVPILLPIASAVLCKVLTWVVHHKDDPPAPPDDENRERQINLDDKISDWDAEFLQVDRDTLFGLILAACYLEVNGLLDVSCHVLATSLWDGVSTLTIRSDWNTIASDPAV